MCIRDSDTGVQYLDNTLAPEGQLITWNGTAWDDTAKRVWTSYTPTITAASGTWTSVSVTGKYMVAFGICHIQVVITITTRGTGANPVFTLPFPALSGSNKAVLPATETNVNGKSGVAKIPPGLTTATVYSYDALDLVTADGAIVSISGSYPIA